LRENDNQCWARSCSYERGGCWDQDLWSGRPQTNAAWGGTSAEKEFSPTPRL